MPFGENKGKGWGYVDREGDFVIAPRFVSASRFSHGLAIVATRDKLHKTYDGFYIDRSGRQAFPTPFKFLSDFVHGLAAVQTDFGDFPVYMNTSGKIVFEYSDDL